METKLLNEAWVEVGRANDSGPRNLQSRRQWCPGNTPNIRQQTSKYMELPITRYNCPIIYNLWANWLIMKTYKNNTKTVKYLSTQCMANTLLWAFARVEIAKRMLYTDWAGPECDHRLNSAFIMLASLHLILFQITLLHFAFFSFTFWCWIGGLWKETVIFLRALGPPPSRAKGSVNAFSENK